MDIPTPEEMQAASATGHAHRAEVARSRVARIYAGRLQALRGRGQPYEIYAATFRDGEGMLWNEIADLFRQAGWRVEPVRRSDAPHASVAWRTPDGDEVCGWRLSAVTRRSVPVPRDSGE